MRSRVTQSPHAACDCRVRLARIPWRHFCQKACPILSKIKEAIAYASPVVHRAALQTVLRSLVALVILLIAPVRVSPAVLPLFGIVIPIELGQVAAHTQERV